MPSGWKDRCPLGWYADQRCGSNPPPSASERMYTMDEVIERVMEKVMDEGHPDKMSPEQFMDFVDQLKQRLDDEVIALKESMD